MRIRDFDLQAENYDECRVCIGFTVFDLREELMESNESKGHKYD